MQNLPALIDTARTTLAEAKTSAEVLEAKAQAQAALHYSKVTKAALQVQGDCLKMVCRAEERFADEIDASGQFNQGRDKRSGDTTFEDIGVSKQQVHSFRKVRDLGGDKVEEIIDKAVAEGRSPTKSEILSHHKEGFIDPNVNPNPPPGFAKRIHFAGYIKELVKMCEEFTPQFIAGACEGTDHSDMLHNLNIVTDWKERFQGESQRAMPHHENEG
jgi:hypothetical protein